MQKPAKEAVVDEQSKWSRDENFYNLENKIKELQRVKGIAESIIKRERRKQEETRTYNKTIENLIYTIIRFEV